MKKRKDKKLFKHTALNTAMSIAMVITIGIAMVTCALSLSACSASETGAGILNQAAGQLGHVTNAVDQAAGADIKNAKWVAGTLNSKALNPDDEPSLEKIEKSIPEYDGSPYAWINEDRPYFSDDKSYFGEGKTLDTSFEYYSPLDDLGRCGTCVACIGKDIMPTEERGSIGMVKPSGWHTIRYDNVDGQYLYNRCHLIAYQLTGENANRSNLITGTRYMNIQGMLPREELVADYVKSTGNHVLYRVTPVFKGDDLVASGVIMEAKSVEDNGAGLEFNVYVYDEQPGIQIDHATGDSKSISGSEVTGSPYAVSSSGASSSSGADKGSTSSGTEAEKTDYIANTNTRKFHYPWCSSVKQMADHNKFEYKGNRQDLIDMGYEPCGNCQP